MSDVPKPYMPKLYVGEKTWKVLKKTLDNIAKEEQKKKDKK